MLEIKPSIPSDRLTTDLTSKDSDQTNPDMAIENSSPHDEDSSGCTRSDTPKADDKMNPSSPEPNVKSVPIHCIIDHGTAPGKECIVDVDTYAIVPGTTLFCEVVRSTLVKIGYTATEALGAKGAVQLRNWKPLSFDSITDDRDATVLDVLGDVSSQATLRIQLGSSLSELGMDEVKEKLLQFLVLHGDSMLKRTGCPLDKAVMQQLADGQKVAALSEDAQDAFNRWYTAHALKYIPDVQRLENGHVSSASPDRALQLSPNLPQGGASPCDALTPHNGAYHRMGPAGFTSRTRLRTSFDQEHEIPRLQKWFEHNQHPCREQMMMFVSELNSLPSRAGRRPLDLTNIIYWFKNARAANRRALSAGRDGVHTNIANFMDAGFHDNSEENDDAFDSDVTASPTIHDMTEKHAHHVPELPNRNAVYVVTPIHHSDPHDRDQIEVVNLPEDDASQMGHNDALQMSHNDSPKDLSMSDRKQSFHFNENPHNLSFSSNKENMLGSDDNDQACDLSLPKKRPYSDDEHQSTERCDISSNKLSRLMIKTEREMEEGYASSNTSSLSPSPRSLNSSTSSLTASLANSQHLSFQHISQQALQMAAMSHALNMHYLNPASLYGHHPTVHPQTPPAHAYPSNHTSPLPHMGSPLPLSNNSRLDGASSPVISAEERKKRSRVFIDPLTEIPKLEKWFLEDTHPSSYMIEKYTDDLNMSAYRQRFPRLEPKNVQLWFKNHRAKVKRARLEQAALSQINNHVSASKSLPSTPSPMTPNPMVSL